MAKGFVSGAIWGTLLSVGGLGTVSVLDSRQSETVLESAVQQDEQPEVDVPAEDAVVDAPATPESDGDAQTEQVEAVAPEPDADMAEVETAPVVDAVDGIDAPEPPQTESEDVTPPAQDTDVAADSDAPDLSTPEQGTDTALDDAADDPAPEPVAEDTVAALTEPETQDSPAPAAPVDSSADTTGAPSAPTLDAPEQEADITVSTEPAAPPAAETTEAPEGATEAESEPVEDAQAEPETGTPERPVVRQLVPDTTPEDDTTEDADTETAALDRPAIGRPASSLLERNSSSSRLPSIGATDDTDAAADAPEVAEQADTRPALQRFAAEVPNADPTLPRMSIVLIDDGSGPLGPDTLDNFPFPVTFALDPEAPDAAERMSAYRALGYEVATLADLPVGAQPTDVEQILGGAIAAVPESVALIEAPGSGVQSERTSTEQTSSFAAESGHGLIFMPNGLNTAEAIARRENVAAVSVLRDFDGDGQDARTKRRFLDGAAFRARQDGDVVMLGRLTPDTVSALLLWSLQDRASSVAIVPVSAILRDTLE